MNRLVLSLIIFLIALANPIFAEDNLKLYISESEIVDNDIISICLETDKDFAGFQFDLYLPNGTSIKEGETPDNGKGSQLPESTVLQMNKTDNCYRFIAYGKSNFYKTRKDIIKIKISIDDDDNNLGRKEIWFKDIKFSDAKGKTGSTPNDLSNTVKIAKVVELTAPTIKTGLEYNGSPQQLITKGEIEGGTIQYSLNGKEYTTTLPEGKDADTYTINYKINGDEKHKDVPPLAKPLEVTITPKQLTADEKEIVLDTSYNYTYNGEEKKPGIKVMDGEIEIPNEEYTVSYNNNINAGTATITISDVENGNYIINGIKEFAIEKSNHNITNPTPYTNLIYTGKPQKLIYGGNSTTGNIVYSTDDTNYSATIPQETDAGKYIVFCKVEGNNNFREYKDNFEIEIAHKEVTVTSKNISKKYGENDPKLNTTISGRVSNEHKIDFTITREPGEDVGDYIITVTGEAIQGNYSVSYVNGVFTVNAKTINPTIVLTQESFTYTGDTQKPGIKVMDGEIEIPNDEYTVSYSDDLINAGTVTITITDKENGNYTIIEKTKKYAIQKADGLFTTVPTAKIGLVYSEVPQDLLDAGTSTTGTVYYSLGGSSYDTSIPQATNAGSYTVYYKLLGDANHYDVQSKSINVTIAPKSLSEPTIELEEYSYTYDGSEKKPVVTLVKDGDTTIPTSEYIIKYEDNKNVGTAKVLLSDKDGGNYDISGSKEFTIIPAEGRILQTPTGKTNLTYNGNVQQLVNKGTSDTGTVLYSLDNINYDIEVPEGTEAMTYLIYYMVEGDANHNAYIPDNNILEVTIAPKSVSTIVLNENDYTYDGLEKKPEVTVKDGDEILSSSEYTVSYSDNINAGTATVTVSDVEGGNYNVDGAVTFKIKKATGELTAPTSKTDLKYLGTAQDLVNAGTSTTGTVLYSVNGGDYSATIPQGTKAGSYTIYYKLEGDINHTSVKAESFKVSIAKALLDTSVGEYSITEGDDIPTFIITYNGFMNQETEEALTTAPKATCKATKNSQAGEYEIKLNGGISDNYDFNYISGKLIIKPIEFVNKDEEDNPQGTYIILSKQKKTASISDDTGLSGECSIPESIVFNGVKYTVTEIAANAFENNTGLTKVVIPNTITNIGPSAFAGCSNLQSITVYIETPIDFTTATATTRAITTRSGGSSIFDGVDKNTCILYVLEQSLDLYKAAPVWNEFQTILPITSSGINKVITTDSMPYDVYNMQGQKVKSKTTNLEGLPQGMYIINGKKIIHK